MSINRFRALVLGLCAILVVALWLGQVNPYLNPDDDSGRYMVLGESLARTGDLRLINDVRQLRDTLYVPGLPALVAFWLKATGTGAADVVLPVKATLLVLLLGTLPLILILLERIRCSRATIAAAMIVYAACPALISFANEVMSEIPLLYLCLASIVMAGTTASRAQGSAISRDGVYGVRPPEGSEAAPGSAEVGPADIAPGSRPYASSGSFEHGHASVVRICLAVLFAVLAYYVRAAGVVLLISLAVWLWRSASWKWGAATVAVTLLVVGTWQLRTSRIIATDPPGTPHDTYVKQFTLKDPENPNAGRIQSNPLGLASRLKRCFSPNIVNISRAVMFSVGEPGTLWQGLFVVIAIPFTALVFIGFRTAWKRGFKLVCGFCALFWLFVTLWPWISPRFLVPIVPYIILFLFVGGEQVARAAGRRLPKAAVTACAAIAVGILLVFFKHAHGLIIAAEHRPTLHGYRLGRSPGEAGFYAACQWLQGRETAEVVMARPTYLMHLYSGHPTTQVEPAVNPLRQERAYMIPGRVRFLVLDRWGWSHTTKYLAPYLRAYGTEWTQAWRDPLGSGVAIYRRNGDTSGVNRPGTEPNSPPGG